MTIHLTQLAANRADKFISSQSNALGIRLGVEKTGCSGWGYIVDIAKEIDPDDQVFVSRGVKIIINQTSLSLLDGTEIDFVQDGLNKVFKFTNPNSDEVCGCGESFTARKSD